MQIYKYLPSDRIGFLSDSMLRFSQPGALNDPFELLPGITDAVIEQMRAHMRSELLTRPASLPGVSRNERRINKRDYKRKATKVFEQFEFDHSRRTCTGAAPRQ